MHIVDNHFHLSTYIIKQINELERIQHHLFILMSSPALSDHTNSAKSRLQNAIRDLIAACRTRAGKGEKSSRKHIKHDGDEREQDRL